jgi:hypothetical protein
LVKLSLRNKAIASVTALLSAAVVCGATSQLGGLGGAWLRPVFGAAPFAMGGAYSASPTYLSPWWNASSLSSLRQTRLYAGTGLRSLGRTDGYGGLEFRIPPRVGMGVLALYRGDPFIHDLYDADEYPIGDMAFTTLTFKVGLSYIINRSFFAGASIGVLYQKLPTTLLEGSRIGYTSTTGIGAFDLSFSWLVNERWTLAAVASNLGAKLHWEIYSADGLSPTVDDPILPAFIAASAFTGSLYGKPLQWNCDVRGYLVDGAWELLDHAEAVVNNGVEWRYWERFYVRAGIGDIAINRDLAAHTRAYFDDFSMRLSAGFSADLARLKPGLRFNYGVSTDKVWAGIDQQLDITYVFR